MFARSIVVDFALVSKFAEYKSEMFRMEESRMIVSSLVSPSGLLRAVGHDLQLTDHILGVRSQVSARTKIAQFLLIVPVGTYHFCILQTLTRRQSPQLLIGRTFQNPLSA